MNCERYTFDNTLTVELLAVAMKGSEQCRNRTDDALNLFQPVTALSAYFWHLGPMGQRP
jgi:hypothetical protein